MTASLRDLWSLLITRIDCVIIVFNLLIIISNFAEIIKNLQNVKEIYNTVQAYYR